jgi:hypothetical protein
MIDIQDATGYGVYQFGGDIEIAETRIRETQPLPGDPTTGVAVFLSGGVTACLSEMFLSSNIGGAIVARDFGTKVYARRLTALNTQVHPTVLADYLADTSPSIDGIGALEIQDHALFLGEFVRVIGGHGLGVSVHDFAQAHLRYSTSSEVQSLIPPDGSTDRLGVNAIVYDSAQLELTTFSLRVAPLCGLYIANALAATSDGWITDSAIGLCLFSDETPFDCIFRDVRMADNARNVDAPLLPVPGPDDCLDPDDDCEYDVYDSPPITCVEVPFLHPWCTE